MSMILTLAANLRHRRRVRRAIREMAALNNDTLRDIGIERGNIPQLVESMMAKQGPAGSEVPVATKDTDIALRDGAPA